MTKAGGFAFIHPANRFVFLSNAHLPAGIAVASIQCHRGIMIHCWE
jgi:hypothetical protein